MPVDDHNGRVSAGSRRDAVDIGYLQDELQRLRDALDELATCSEGTT